MSSDIKKSKLAVGSLVAAIVGILTLGLLLLPSLAAIALGHVAAQRISDSRGILSGRGIAIAGYVTGYAGLVLLIAVSNLGGLMMP